MDGVKNDNHLEIPNLLKVSCFTLRVMCIVVSLGHASSIGFGLLDICYLMSDID